MATVEIDSFVLKLKILWKAGRNANLSIDTNAGKVALTLRVEDLEESDPVPDAQHQRFRRSRNGPAQQRRRERRAAARESPAVEAVEGKAADEDNLLNHRAVEASGEHASEEDSDKGVGDLKLVFAEENTDAHDNENAEQADGFHCLLCDFRSNWANGLKMYVTGKHQKIEQLDGSNSADEDLDKDEKYSNTKQYWETGKLGTIFQNFIDANYIIDNSELQEQCKTIEKAKILEARKCSFGTDYKYYPPWR